MNRQIDLDELLENTAQLRYYGDGSAERVWGRAADARRKTRHTLRWAITAVAACAVLTALFATPQVREAALYMFGPAQGPAIAESTIGPAGSAEASGSVDFINTNDGVPATLTFQGIQPGGEWVRDVKAGIKDVTYDGIDLIVRYSVCGSAVDHFMVHDAPPEGRTAQDRRFDYGGLTVNGVKLKGRGESSDYENGAYVPDESFDVELLDGVSGVVQAELEIDFSNEVNDSTGNGTLYPAGSMLLRFSIDLTAAKASVKSIGKAGTKYMLSGELPYTQDVYDQTSGKETFTNKKVSLDGCAFELVSAFAGSKTTLIKLRFIPSQNLGKDVVETIVNNLGINLLADGVPFEEFESTTGDVMDSGADVIISAPAPRLNSKKLTVAISLQYNRIPGGTFDIELPK